MRIYKRDLDLLGNIAMLKRLDRNQDNEWLEACFAASTVNNLLKHNSISPDAENELRGIYERLCGKYGQ